MPSSRPVARAISRWVRNSSAWTSSQRTMRELLGAKTLRGRPTVLKRLGLPSTITRMARRDDVRVAREVEPADARLLAHLAADLAHEGDHHERHGSAPDASRAGLGLLRGGGDRRGSRGLVDHDDEGRPGGDDQIGAARVIGAHVEVGRPDSEEAGQDLGHLGRHAAVFRPRSHA